MPNRARNIGPMEKGQRVSRTSSALDGTKAANPGRWLIRTTLACGFALLALSQSVLAGDCANWNGDGFFGATSIDTLQECLRGGADPNARNEVGETPLYGVLKAYSSSDAGEDREAFALIASTLLLDEGADPNAATDDDKTPLYFAARYEDPVIAVALLQAGADPNAGPAHLSPLLSAVLYGSAEIVSALLAFGADVHMPGRDGRTALRYAVGMALSDEQDGSALVTILLEAGADPNAADSSGYVPLHDASYSTSGAGVVHALLAAGADPNARTDEGNTPLHFAASSEPHADVLAALLGAGADIGARNNDGWEPIHVASTYTNDPGIVAILLDAGAGPNAKTDDDWTPLHLAAMYTGNTEVITVLTDAGADPNARAAGDSTPLHMTARHSSHSDVVSALLDAGADLSPLDQAGWSPLAEAIAFNTAPWAAFELLEAHAIRDGAQGVAGSEEFWQPGLHEVRCWFESPSDAENVTCFYMVVRETYGDPSGKLTTFPVVKFANPQPSNRRNPVLHLGGGGPGNAAWLETDLSHLRPYYADLAWASGRDFYVVDPRGVGMSHPRLQCTEFFGSIREMLATEATERDDLDSWLDVYRRCKQKIDAYGHDLSQYNSRVVAQDIELLRHALQVEQWALFGYSYATRYALTIARDFPDSVESMVLTAATFPNVSLVEKHAELEQRAFERAFSLCGDDGACQPSSLQERLQVLVDRLNEAPIVVDNLSELFSGEYEVDRFVITGERLVEMSFLSLYDSNFSPRLTELVAEMERGERDLLTDAIWTYLSFYFDLHYSDSVYVGHYCAEQHPFVNFDELMRLAQDAPRYVRDFSGDYPFHDYAQQLCELWNVPAAGLMEGSPVVTSVPTLFLQGALDPVTPIDYLGNQLRHFENHAVLIFADSSHWGAVEGACAMEAAAYFVANKRLEKQKAACADATAAVNYRAN